MLDERRECTEGGSAEVRSSKIPYLQILQMKQGQTVTPTWAVKENPNEVWIWSETVEIVQMFSSAWCNPNEVWIWSKKVQMFPHIHVSNKTSLKYNSWYRDKKSSINKYMENPNAREALQLKHWHFFFIVASNLSSLGLGTLFTKEERERLAPDVIWYFCYTSPPCSSRHWYWLPGKK